MLNKKLMMLAILLVSLLAISAVSAADNVTSDIASADQTTDEIASIDENSEILEEDNEGTSEILSDDNEGTFSELQTIIDEAPEGSTINLNKNYGDEFANAEIEKNIKINGNGHTIRGTLNIYSADVALYNIRFISYYAITDNGCINWQGNNGIIDNCSIENMVTRDKPAIYLAGDNCIIKDSSFVNLDPMYNSVITLTKDNCIIKDSNFVNIQGYAIIWEGHDGTLSNSNFVNTESDFTGGTIALRNTNINIDNCNFVNRTGSYGSAIYSENSYLNISNCNFVNNTDIERIFYSGSAIYSENGELDIDNCSFVNNVGLYGGAAVYSSNENVRIANTLFMNNSPDDFYPNDIYTENIKITSHINVDRSIFVNSEDIEIGINLDEGATGEVIAKINGIEKRLSLTNSHASLKTNLNLGTHDLTVKYLGDDTFSPNEKTITLKVVEASFKDLQELIDNADDGQVIELNHDYIYAESRDSYSPVQIRKNIRIKGNGHTLDGNNKNSILNIMDSNVILENMNFKNGLNDNGGAIHSDNSNLNIINSNLTKNYAYASGGVIYSSGTLTLENCNFADNSVDPYASGGAIFSLGTLTLNECSFTNNTILAGYGGAIYADADLTINNSRFMNNSGAQDGGAVCANYNLVVLNSYFIGNSAILDSGAIFWSNGNAILTNCEFVNNQAPGDCSAIKLNGNNCTLIDCNFMNNTLLAGDGGAVYWNSENGILTNCEFINNDHAVYWNSENGILTNCEFVNNYAALYWNGENGILTNCEFVNNTGNEGGALIWNGNYGILFDCNFVNNTALWAGGSVAWYGNNGTIYDCIFKNSLVSSGNPDGFGGGLYFTGANCSLINPIFEGNYADIGPDWYSFKPLNYIDKTPLTNISTVIKSSDINSTYGTSQNLIITLNDIYGRYIVGAQINILFNNKEYILKTNYRSQVSLVIPENLNPNTYVATISYGGNDKYNPSTTKTNIVVNKIPTSISASDISVKYGDESAELVATLTNDLSGEPLSNENVIVNINNKEYALKTDSEGQVKVSTKDLNLGTYITKISYNGNDLLNSSSKTVRIVVSNDGTFTELYNEIVNAGTLLNLNRNYTYRSTDSDYKEGIVIDKSITINGNGYTINGFNQARIFNIEGSDVTLTNINFVNSASSGNGGAINWNGDEGILTNCNFVNSFADCEGGAINWNGDKGVLSHCSFVNSSSNYAGGAINWNGGNCILSYNTFVNSSSDSYGGAISMGLASYDLIDDVLYMATHNNTVINCNFVNSSTNGDGGAVMWWSDNSLLANCSFENSFANDEGGAVKLCINLLDTGRGIVFTANNNSVVNCSFINNYLKGGYGGAINWNSGNSILANCNFINNHIKGDTGYGGAIKGCGENSIISNCSFINNYLKGGYGGAINWYGENCIISNCSFINNHIKGDRGYGGAIEWSGEKGVLTNCNFVNCSSSFDSGAISWLGSNSLLSNCNITNCSSGFRSGAIYWQGSNSLLTNCNFINCSSGYDSGAINYYGENSNLTNCNFINSSSVNAGGAISWHSDNGVLANCNFINSHLSSDGGRGGAISWEGDYGSIINSSFINSHANDRGGGIDFSSSRNCNLINSTFKGNFAQTGSEWYSEKYLNVINVTIIKISTAINAPDVSTSYGGSANLTATLKDTNDNILPGKQISIVLNGVEYILETDSAGQVSLAIPQNLNPKTYTATISFAGNDAYDPVTETAKVIVNKAGTMISAPDVNVAYKDPDAELVATIINEHGKPLVVNLNVNFNGENYTVKTDSNGQAKIAIGTLSPGTYAATITYKGSSNYQASTTTAKVKVTKSDTTISASDVTVAYKDPNGELTTTIINEHGKPLVVNLNVDLNGKTYTVKTDSNGQAIIAIGTMSPGTYTATISYKGSSNYKASTTTAKVKVTKADTIISASDVSVAYKDPNGELAATIINEHGKPLVVSLNFNINGKTYTAKTDSNGQANIAVDTLTPGTYTATITYKGSSNYQTSTTTAKVKVTKSDTTITAPDVTVAYKNPNGELVATIVNEHGKPLVVTLNVELNGKTYTAKTDSNGQANIAVDTLTPGTYTATITYKGSSNYQTSSTTAKVKITKADTIITAPDVTVAKNDPDGKLVSTIVNEHGKPLVVSLNVNINGKDYTVKTDSNGQASVSTANLAPGTYTATISYKGSSNYKASTTTANVKVKK